MAAESIEMNDQDYRYASQICVKVKSERYDLDDKSPHSILHLGFSPSSSSIQIWGTSGIEIRTQLRAEPVEVPEIAGSGTVDELPSACMSLLSFVRNHIGLCGMDMAAIQKRICEKIRNDGYMNKSERRCKRAVDVYLKIVTRYHQDSEGICSVNWSAIGTLERGIVKDEEEGEICSVCLGKFRVGWQVSHMPCRHMFHHQCLVYWLTIKNCCPLCRYEMPHARMPYKDEQ